MKNKILSTTLILIITINCYAQKQKEIGTKQLLGQKGKNKIDRRQAWQVEGVEEGLERPTQRPLLQLAWSKILTP